MPWFMTEYRSDWARRPSADRVTAGNYGGNLWAPNRERAARIAKQRGMNERIVGLSGRKSVFPYFPAHRMCDRYEQDRTLAKFRDAVHALTYLGMIALASGRATPNQILGDEGVIHDFIHSRHAFMRSYEAIRYKIRQIERRTPGYLAQEKRAR